MSRLFGSQKFQKFIQLLLIVVLLASTFAFLPQPAIAKGKAKGSVGALTAKLNGKKVSVTGTGFPKSHEFVLNAKSGKGNTTKLGTVKSSAAGGFSATYTLPDKFKINKSLTVCAKDNKTSKRTCTTTK